jgi:dGTPase
LEVAQISRTIARALRLNEDLTEAIALGHDVGHTPFGHAGEAALEEAIKELHARNGNPTGAPETFKHYEQSLRVLMVLEDLNLSDETIAGIGGHSKGRKDLTAADGQPTSTLEAAVVRVSDRIAYLNHDLDDALRSGIIPAVPEEFMSIGPTHSKRIGAMVGDVIINSLDQPAVRMSSLLMQAMNELKEWLFENVYLKYPLVYPDSAKAEALVKELFFYYAEPDNLPLGFEGIQGAIDYVAGMTDRFAIETYTNLKLPKGFRSI